MTIPLRHLSSGCWVQRLPTFSHLDSVPAKRPAAPPSRLVHWKCIGQQLHRVKMLGYHTNANHFRTSQTIRWIRFTANQPGSQTVTCFVKTFFLVYKPINTCNGDKPNHILGSGGNNKMYSLKRNTHTLGTRTFKHNPSNKYSQCSKCGTINLKTHTQLSREYQNICHITNENKRLDMCKKCWYISRFRRAVSTIDWSVLLISYWETPF